MGTLENLNFCWGSGFCFVLAKWLRFLQLRTSLQPRNVRQEQEDMRPLATRDQVEDVVGGWKSSDGFRNCRWEDGFWIAPGC